MCQQNLYIHIELSFSSCSSTLLVHQQSPTKPSRPHLRPLSMLPLPRHVAVDPSTHPTYQVLPAVSILSLIRCRYWRTPLVNNLLLVFTRSEYLQTIEPRRIIPPWPDDHALRASPPFAPSWSFSSTRKNYMLTMTDVVPCTVLAFVTLVSPTL